MGVLCGNKKGTWRLEDGMPMLIRIAIGALILSIQAACIKPVQAQTENGSDIPVCGADASPYRDLDFLVGEWEFFLEDGTKLAEQTYFKREEGCLILEDWRTVTGETGTGMNFVDPATGRWRQVWMSPNFHLDYSGTVDEKGILTLEGRMYPNNGAPGAQIRGVYTPLEDGSVTKEFLMRADDDDEWRQFFIGVARRPAEN